MRTVRIYLASGNIVSLSCSQVVKEKGELITRDKDGRENGRFNPNLVEGFAWVQQ